MNQSALKRTNDLRRGLLQHQASFIIFTTCVIILISSHVSSQIILPTSFSPFNTFLRPLEKITQKSDGLLVNVLTGRAQDVLASTFGTFLSSINTCIVNKTPWSDPDLGSFGTDSRYCDARCLRNLFCCSPESKEALNVQFLYTSASEPKMTKILRYGDEKSRQIVSKSNRTVVFIVHGFLNHYFYESMWNQTRDSHLTRGNDVVIVDWSRGNRLYLQSMANVRVVGALLGQLVSFLKIAERTLCVGFSLGSHVCGEAGSWIQERGSHPINKIAKCIGVDPAGPGFDGCSNDIRLDPSDCKVVTVIHSSQFVEMLGFGTRFKSGHCDFWMNDGRQQPECSKNPPFHQIVRDTFYGNLGSVGSTLENAVGCSHVRAMRYYLHALQRKCNFTGLVSKGCGLGKKCVVESFLGKSKVDDKMIPKTMPLSPDDSCQPGMNVDFWAETSGSEPFCLEIFG